VRAFALHDARPAAGSGEWILSGKPALNAVALAHARRRTRSRKAGEIQKPGLSRERYEQAVRRRDRRLVDAYSFD
jgi:hypothetical protein